MRVGVMLRHIAMRGGIGVTSRALMHQLLASSPEDDFVLYYDDVVNIGRYSTYSNVTETIVESRLKIVWDQVRIPQAARRDKLDVLFNPKLSVPLWGDVPSIFLFHGPETYVVPDAYSRTDLIQSALLYPRYAAKATATIVSTQDAREKANRYLGISLSRIHVIPPGRDESFVASRSEDVREVRARLGIPEAYFLFVGGLYPIKNFGRLLDAMAELQSRLSNALPPLVAVGFRRWKMDAELRKIDEMNLRDNILFPGFVSDDDLKALYTGCRAFVFPSLYEGFGLAALEAMSCGAPVVTSNRGGTAEIGKDGAALLVDPYNSSAIADAIFCIHTDPVLKDRLSSAGIKRASQFTYEKMAHQVKDLLRTVARPTS